MDASAFEFMYGNEEQLPAHKKEMLEACRAGDLSWLQQLYQKEPSWTGRERPICQARPSHKDISIQSLALPNDSVILS